MTVAAKLAGYGLVLAAAFGAALGVGAAVGPSRRPPGPRTAPDTEWAA